MHAGGVGERDVEGAAVVAGGSRRPLRIAHCPWKNGLEGGEKIEEGDGQQDAVVGRYEPRRQCLSVAHT